MPTDSVRRLLAVSLVGFLMLVACACTNGSSGSNTTATPNPANANASAASGSATVAEHSNLALSSPAFHDGAAIPKTYTCDGESISPPLDWTGEPGGTRGFALILHDPDAPHAGGFTHWVVYDLRAGAARLNAGASPHGTLPTGARQGENDAHTSVYAPPCPPSGGSVHHYNFTLYALDANLELGAGKSRADVEKAIQGHVLAQATLTGLFGH